MPKMVSIEYTYGRFEGYKGKNSIQNELKCYKKQRNKIKTGIKFPCASMIFV